MPFFVENEQGDSVTVNGNRYRVMLNEFYLQKLRRRIRVLATFGFNRTALCATQLREATLDVLRPVFEDRIIGRSIQ